MRSFVIGTCHRILLEEKQMGHACGMYGGEEKHVKGFDGKL